MAGSIPYHAEYALRTIFKRCVDCANIQPSCPDCSSDETCIQMTGDCNTCPQATCVPKSQAGAQTFQQGGGGGGPNVGAIAGGVVGGVVFIAVITFVLWRFCIRPRYNNYEAEEAEYQDEYAMYPEEKSSPRTVGDDEYTPTSQARQSHASHRSVASTVMTRASNVIQIAFIPGITDRQNHHDSASEVPPVPSIPRSKQRITASSTVSPINRDNHPGTPDHFFTPADLAAPASRWSQFSNSTEDSEDIRSTRHQSLASSLARESVASAIYNDGHTATALATPISASQISGVRGKANVVSVKPSTGNTPGSLNHVPEVPAVDYFKYGDAKKAAEAEEQKNTAESSNGNPAATSDKSMNESEDSKKPSNRALAVAIEEATRRASRQPTHGGLGSISIGGQGKSSQLAKPEGQGLKQRDPSPFSDSNAVLTP